MHMHMRMHILRHNHHLQVLQQRVLELKQGGQLKHFIGIDSQKSSFI